LKPRLGKMQAGKPQNNRDLYARNSKIPIYLEVSSFEDFKQELSI